MDYSVYEGTFLGSKDTKLYYSYSKVDNPRGVVVFVHGICEHLGRYDYLTKKFNESSYNVYRFDLRGHGKSMGKRGYLEDFFDYLNDLNILIDMVRKENEKIRLILLGHSMGGLIVTAYASKYPNKIDLLVVSGGANVCPKAASALKFLPYNIMGKLQYVNKLGNGVCSDPEVVKKYEEDPLVLKKVSYRLLGNAFIKGTKFVKENISNITCPTIVMHGENDGIVVQDTGKWTYENLQCKDKTLKIYSGLYHEIFNEVKKDEVIKDAIDWCNERSK